MSAHDDFSRKDAKAQSKSTVGKRSLGRQHPSAGTGFFASFSLKFG
jgi:hypothetical protein